MNFKPEETTLPPILERWTTGLLAEPLPPESRATCADCAMLDPDRALAELFPSDLKCCAHDPQLPNFVVGAVLLDESAELSEGRERVKARIIRGMAVSPLGFGARPRFSATPGFGRAGGTPCTYFDASGGGCTIWRHREAGCSTWFCKYQRGERGFRFWVALRRLLKVVEASVVRACLVELGLGSHALSLLFPASERSAGTTLASRTLRIGQLPASVDPAAWGGWADRKEAFFRACAEVATRLSWPEALATAGSEGAILAALARQAFDAMMAREVPDALVREASHDDELRTDTMLVTTFSSYDRVALDLPLYDALRRFDGRPNAVVLADILTHDAIALDDERVRTLVEQGILTPASPTRDPTPSIADASHQESQDA